jgi:hypothetical protein
LTFLSSTIFHVHIHCKKKGLFTHLFVFNDYISALPKKNVMQLRFLCPSKIFRKFRRLYVEHHVSQICKCVRKSSQNSTEYKICAREDLDDETVKGIKKILKALSNRGLGFETGLFTVSAKRFLLVHTGGLHR